MKVPNRRESVDTHYQPYPPSSAAGGGGNSAGGGGGSGGGGGGGNRDSFAHPGSSARPSPAGRKSGSAASSTAAAAAALGEGDGDVTQYKVARAISSCTRCRSRKQRCDGKLPACSACERANVECIGFDAISKTNVSRNYLHTLEEEVASLRAQVAALTDRDHDVIGNTKRSIAAHANAAVHSFRPDANNGGLAIDPTLMHGDGGGHDTPMRSPWDSPGGAMPPYGQSSSSGFGHARRASDYFPPQSSSSASPYGGGPGAGSMEPPRSPYVSRNPSIPGLHSTSLTRLVHDATLKTGHAHTHHPLTSSSGVIAGSNPSTSEKGSVVGNDSPAQLDDSAYASPDRATTPRLIGAGTNARGSGDSSLPVAVKQQPQHHQQHHPQQQHRPGSSPLQTSMSIGSSAASHHQNKLKRHKFPVPPLPPQAAVERLVAAYVDFVGVAAPIVHIPTLGKQLNRIREGVDVEEADVFVVMMVLALSTMASSRFVDPPDELRSCSEAFHAEAMKHLDAVFEEQSYVGLQAILLLIWYALLNPDKGSVWFLIGLATRTCVDLGFHNEHNAGGEQLDVLELDMRRRLFWITYKMDRLLSASLGRPPSIPDGFINVPMPAPLHDVDISAGHFGPLSGEPCSYKAVFLHTIRMRQLQSEILTNTYGCHGTAGPPPEWFDDIFERLKEWLATTPEPRGTQSAEGYAIAFHNAALLLWRPSRGNPHPDRKALSTVLASSSYIIRIYRRMQLNNRISWLWMTSHYCFMAGLSFLYAYFNLYTAGGPGVPTAEEAMMDVESALAVLEFLSPQVPSAGACHETMRSVSQAIFERLSKNVSSSNNTAAVAAAPSAASPGSRALLRGAPISSSRDDPLPNPNESFPAPLPNVPLPYELSLLDNLFLNPMAPHNKASDYTNGGQKRIKGQMALDVRNSFLPSSAGGVSGQTGGPGFGTSGGVGGAGGPQGFPPGAFHTFPASDSLGAYGMAAQVGTPGGSGGGVAGGNNGGAAASPGMGIGGGSGGGSSGMISGLTGDAAIDPSLQGAMGNGNGHAHGFGGGAAGGNGGMAGMGAAGHAGSLGGSGNDGTAGGIGPDPNFDVLSYLMDEEGLTGASQSWENMEFPADFSFFS